MFTKQSALLALCAFAFGLGLTGSAIAACNDNCRRGCERDYRTCRPGAGDCELNQSHCLRRCGCVVS